MILNRFRPSKLPKSVEKWVFIANPKTSFLKGRTLKPKNFQIDGSVSLALLEDNFQIRPIREELGLICPQVERLNFFVNVSKKYGLLNFMIFSFCEIWEKAYI